MSRQRGFINLKEFRRGRVPGWNLPEAVEAMRREGGVVDEQSGQFTLVEEVELFSLVLHLFASQRGKGGGQAMAVSPMRLQRARQGTSDPRRWRSALARLQVVDVGAREPRRPRQLSL